MQGVHDSRKFESDPAHMDQCPVVCTNANGARTGKSHALRVLMGPYWRQEDSVTGGKVWSREYEYRGVLRVLVVDSQGRTREVPDAAFDPERRVVVLPELEPDEHVTWDVRCKNCGNVYRIRSDELASWWSRMRVKNTTLPDPDAVLAYDVSSPADAD